MKRLLVLATLFFAVSLQASVVQTTYTKASLIADHSVASPGQTLWLSVELEHKNGWHSYWKNPGETGLPTRIQWRLPKGVSLGDIHWPSPDIFTLESLVNYGYDKASLLLPLNIAPEFVGDTLHLEADVSLLVCDTLCIPERFSLSLSVPVASSPQVSKEIGLFQAARAALPRKALKGTLQHKGTNTVLSVRLPSERLSQLKEPYFFPEQRDTIAYTLTQNSRVEGDVLSIRLPNLDEEPVQHLTGLLRVHDALFVTINAESDSVEALSFVAFLLLCLGAFLGGIILNIMPCVLPIISLKVFGILSKSSIEQKEIRKQAQAYTSGIIVSFAFILALLYLVKFLGYQVGWGFQLQQPLFVYALSLLLVIVGLQFNNILALPQFILDLPHFVSTLINRPLKKGSVSDFFTGVLAVFVATPCTAPFMATAIGVALIQTPLIMALIFLSLALGFAAPYLLIAYVPRLQRYLPKPGPWMNTGKQLLSIPIYLTVLWLVWVMAMQIGPIAYAYAAVSIVLVLAWVFVIRGVKKALVQNLTLVLLIVAIIGLGIAIQQPRESHITKTHSVSDIQRLLNEKKRVFVDVTAAWCITCKVNEELVLNRPDIMDFFEKEAVHKVVLDWTDYNKDISAYLERFNRAGVPLYVYYNEAGEPVILPQVLTKKLIYSSIKGSQK